MGKGTLEGRHHVSAMFFWIWNVLVHGFMYDWVTFCVFCTSNKRFLETTIHSSWLFRMSTLESFISSGICWLTVLLRSFLVLERRVCLPSARTKWAEYIKLNVGKMSSLSMSWSRPFLKIWRPRPGHCHQGLETETMTLSPRSLDWHWDIVTKVSRLTLGHCHRGLETETEKPCLKELKSTRVSRPWS